MNYSGNEKKAEDDILGVNLKVLRLVGLWRGNLSNTEHSWAMKIFTVYRFTLVIFIVLHMITEYLDILFTWGDLENLADTGCVALLYTVCFVKQIMMLFCEERIEVLVTSLRTGYFTTSLRWSKEHNDILRSPNRLAYVLSWTFYYICITTIIAFVTRAILTSYVGNLGFGGNTEGNKTTKTLVFKAWYPFDIQEPGNYEIAFCFQLIPNCVGPTINAGVDTFITSLIIHCCGQFKILKYSLRKIKDRAEELFALEKSSIEGSLSAEDIPEFNKNIGRVDDVDTNLDVRRNLRLYINKNAEISEEHSNLSEYDLQIKSYTCLKECIHHHQMLLNFVADMEIMLNPIFFVQFLVSTCLICLILFYLAMNTGNDGILNQLTFITLLIVALTQLLLFCWFGNNLTYESDSLTKAIYDSPWYESSHCFKKSMGIMLSRTMLPSYLTGGKLYILSLETYRAILGASFSYYTVLRNINNT